MFTKKIIDWFNREGNPHTRYFTQLFTGLAVIIFSIPFTLLYYIYPPLYNMCENGIDNASSEELHNLYGILLFTSVAMWSGIALGVNYVI